MDGCLVVGVYPVGVECIEFVKAIVRDITALRFVGIRRRIPREAKFDVKKTAYNDGYQDDN